MLLPVPVVADVEQPAATEFGRDADAEDRLRGGSGEKSVCDQVNVVQPSQEWPSQYESSGQAVEHHRHQRRGDEGISGVEIRAHNLGHGHQRDHGEDHREHGRSLMYFRGRDTGRGDAHE